MGLLAFDDALAEILSGATALDSEWVALEAADRRVVSAPVIARHTQPPFDGSAMDGYAVRAADVATLPSTLNVIGESAAGRRFSGAIGPGEAVRIFTGAPLPTGADAIVIQENTVRDGTTVTVTQGTVDPAHVRKSGRDFIACSELITAGTTLTPRLLAFAAAAGHPRVAVHRRPVVRIIATGDELVMPGTPLGPDQIVCSNSFGVDAMATRAGADSRFLGIARDRREVLADMVDACGDADLIVTIGGASVGDHDLVGPVLTDRGVDLAFWKIAMRPGKPLMFGRRGAQRFVGLPGNPVSALVCARVFLVPLIRALIGSGDDALAAQPAVLTESVEANGPRKHFMRALVATGADGRRQVMMPPSQDSSLLSTLAAANAFLVRDPGASALGAGADVTVLPLDF